VIGTKNVLVVVLSQLGFSEGMTEPTCDALSAADGIPLLRYLLEEHGTAGAVAMTRTTAHDLICSGCVTLNGALVEPTQASGCVLVRPGIDAVAVDAAGVSAIRVWVLNKAEGIDSTLVEAQPASVLHVMRRAGLTNTKNFKKRRLDGDAAVDLAQPPSGGDDGDNGAPALVPAFPIGRLDKDSCGMLLLTNCGPLSHRLTHPSFNHEKEYAVTVNMPAPLPDRFYDLMRGGVSWTARNQTFTSDPCRVVAFDAARDTVIEPKSVVKEKQQRAVASAIREGQTATFRIVLTQGLNRQIRQMVAAAGDIIQSELTGAPRAAADNRRLRLSPRWLGAMAGDRRQPADGEPQVQADATADAVDVTLPDAPTGASTSGEAGANAAAAHPDRPERREARYCVLRLQRIRVGPLLLADVGPALAASDHDVVEVGGDRKAALLAWAFAATAAP
jgi:pseudouridine synthase